jgi:hypothetical protein
MKIPNCANIRHLPEDVAKTKWCPQIRRNMTTVYSHTEGSWLPSGPSGNWSNGPVGNCVGSRCFMWSSSIFDRSYGRCGLCKYQLSCQRCRA